MRMLLVLLIAVALVCGCTGGGTKTTTTEPASDIAMQKCTNDGGGITRSSGTSGTVYCLFIDGTVCEIQSYYQNACAKGDCPRTCLNSGTQDEGWYDCKGNLILWDKCQGETSKKTSC
ncbi:MAG: hypothetical protein PHG85_07125 [Candidatus Altiarchaeota archaeon]|nr:hypothetical protein [Candidatus Altiarchaeota archaeon]